MSFQEVISIGELAEFTSGHGFKQSEWSKTGYPIIRIQNLNGSRDFNHYEGEAEAAWVVEPGELLFAWAGSRGISFGPCRWTGPRGVLNQHIYRVRPREGVEPRWLEYILQLITAEIERKAHGFKSSLVHVSKSDITSQKVVFPTFEEQFAIADCLERWEAGTTVEGNLLNKLSTRRQGLMKQLLTGERRLPGFLKEWHEVRLGDVLTESRISGSTGETARKLTVRWYGTGEIIRNQATRKFIPVIRQASGESLLPRCLSTRHYINLSGPDQRGSEWEKLVRDIHNTPKFSRPPLGVNPFPTHEISSADAKTVEVFEDGDANRIALIYEKALRVAHSNDVREWRNLVEEAKSNSVSNLISWKNAREVNFPRNDSDLASYMVDAVSTYAPIFAIAIAGVMSGEEKYVRQVGLIDWILDPPGWEVQGRAEINMIPELITFAYQAVLGAAALHSEQAKIAFDLANARIRRPWDPPGESILLFKSTKFIGWPTSMKGYCNLGWNFLNKLIAEWTWLSRAFGDGGAMASVHAHYLFLNVLDFVSRTRRTDKGSSLGEARGPLYVGVADDSIKARAYSVLLLSGEFLKKLIEENGITQSEFERLWPAWIDLSNEWVRVVCKSHRGDELPHKFLHRDLISKGGDLTIE